LAILLEGRIKRRQATPLYLAQRVRASLEEEGHHLLIPSEGGYGKRSQAPGIKGIRQTRFSSQQALHTASIPSRDGLEDILGPQETGRER
jgi:hypothetical protein